MTTDDKRNPLIYLFIKNWQYSKGNHKNIVLFWCMFIVSQCVNVFMPPLVTAKIIDVITKEGINNNNINFLLLLVGLVLVRSILFWSIHGTARVIEVENAFKVRVNYRKFLLKGVMTMPLDWHVGHHSGDIIDKVEKGANGLYAFSENSYESIYAIVQLIGCFGMLVYFIPHAGYIVLIMLSLSAWLTVRLDKILIPQYLELNKAENAISESVFDSISNIGTVIILRVERLVFDAMVHKLEKPFDLFKKNARINELKWALTSFCCNSMIVIVVAIYFWQHMGTDPGIAVGSFYLLITYLDRISELFFRFAGSYNEIIKRRSRIANAESLSVDFREVNLANHVLPKDWRILEIRNLNFSYYGGEYNDLHLKDIALSIRRDEKIAFVGESGSGKTTLLKIIRDLHQPKDLELLVDGENIPGGFERISRAISLIPQDPEMFATTILANITMGAEYEMEFVRRFTDMACFTNVIDGLPNGLDSSIKEKGVNLSGGQKQRLALARGFLASHDKDIVLLDEPTSSLDTATEMEVYRNIFEAFREKVVISSIHRLHLLPMFDRIYMFDKGQIVGSGTLDELLNSCSQFKILWKQYNVHGLEDGL